MNLKNRLSSDLLIQSNVSFVDSISKVEKKVVDEMDTLNPKQELSSHPEQLYSLGAKLSSRIDSLGSLKLSDTILTRSLNKLETQIDSIKNIGPTKDIKQTQERIASFENNLSDKVNPYEEKVNEKLGLFSQNGGNMPGGVNLPAADLNTSLPAGPNLNAPDVNVPQVNNPVESIDIPDTGINGNLGELPKLPDLKTGDIKAPAVVTNIQDKLGGVNEFTDQAKGYQDDLKNLQDGDVADLEKLPDNLESKVENLDQLEGFKEQVTDFEAVKKNWNDPEVMKEEALNKAKETAVNHFAGHEEELKAAMQKMSKLKSKIPDPEGAIDLFKKRQQFLKGKPIVERFIPGLTFQIQNQQSFWLDLNPQLAFKISGRWLAGSGWNERLAYKFKEGEWDHKYRIYGVRSFVHFKFKAGFWLKADIETMNAPFKPQGFKSNEEIVGRAWVWSFPVGIKKDFQFSKGFKGNVQTLYNIYDKKRNSPYLSKFNVRMGFEWPLSKRLKEVRSDNQQ